MATYEGRALVCGTWQVKIGKHTELNTMVMIHMAHQKNVDKSKADDKYVVQRIGGGSIVDRRPIFSPDGKLLYVVYGHVIRAFSTQSGEQVRDFRGLSHPAVGVQVHPTRPELVVAVSESGEMMAWRWESGIHMMTVRLRVAGLANEDVRLTGFKLLPSEDGDCDVYVTWHRAGRKAEMSIFSSKGRHKVDLNFKFDNSSHSVAFAFGQHYDGRYVVAISREKLYTIDVKRNQGKWYKVSGKRLLTCVACHPTELCVATGDNTGRVIIWKDVLDNDQPPSAIYHWHTLPVTDVVFSPSGSFFYSGGGECTLVKWRLDSPHDKSFIPRLSAPICHLNVSKDSLYVSVSTQDNAIQIVDSQRNIKKTVQYFSWGVQSAGDDTPLFPAGLNLDHRTHSLVLNSRAGHIQFYDPRTHSLLYNLDITGFNYLTQERNTKIFNVEVIRLALTRCGKWLSTVEFIDNGELSVQCTLKFYSFNETTQNYSLNTAIDMPHDGRVHALQFQPAEGPNSVLSAVTTGDDKKFRIWSFESEKNSIWYCSSVGYYRGQPVKDAAFSPDGSVLGVTFGPSLTLWNPENCNLQCSLSSANASDSLPIKFIQFGSNECCHLVVTGTSEALTVWNILTLSIVWTVPLRLSILTKDPCSNYMAAFTENNTVFIFSPSSSSPVFRFANVCPSDKQILSAIFMPRQKPRNDGSWQASSQLFFIDSNQELLSLQRAEEVYDANEIGLGLPDWTPSLTPFSSLLAQQASSAAAVHKEKNHKQLGEPGKNEIEEFLSAPAHTMPPLHLLCGGLLGAFLSKEKTGQDEDGDADPGEAAVKRRASDASDSDEEGGQVKRQDPGAQQRPAEAVVSEVEADVEKALEEVLAEPMDWARGVLW